MASLLQSKFAPSEQAAIARLFSTNVVRELAIRGESPLLGRLLPQTGLTRFLASDSAVRDLFEVAFTVLRRPANRHEYVYKNALARKLLLGTHSPKSAVMLTEFRVGECKADVVVLNGSSVVYEIKSERDTLARVRRQVAAYLEVFERVNLFVGRNHLDAAEAVVPDEVGLITLSERFQLSVVRRPRANTGRLLPTKIFECLQRREAELVLQTCGRPVPSLPNTQMYAALRATFAEMAPEEIHRAAVGVLKRTRSNQPTAEAFDTLPDALSATLLSVRLRKCDRVRLANSMGAPMAAVGEWARK